MLASKIALYFMRKKKTWQYYYTIKSLVFEVYKYLYKLKNTITEKRENAGAGFALLKLSFFSLVMPILISLFLYFSQSFFSNFFKELSFKVDGGGNYGTLLGVVTSISGVFIGLYFSAMVAIAGVIYANTDDKIRRVLINDRLSNFYLRFLSLFTVFGVIQLCLNCLGVATNPLSIVLIFIGSAVAAMSFIPLGKRMFELFDPSRLSLLVMEKVNKSINNVVAGNSLWYEKSFQAHEYKLAKANLLTLVRLTELIGRNQITNGHRFVGVATELVVFLYNYRKLKNKIPTNSIWFEDIYEYEKLYFTPGFKLDVNFATATLASPQSIKNHNWLEKTCFSIIVECLNTNVKNKRYDEINGTMIAIQNYFEQSSLDGDIELSIELLNDVYRVFNDAENIKLLTLGDGGLSKTIGVWEYLSSLPIMLFLSYVRFVEKIDLSAMNDLVESINWFDKRNIYLHKFSRESLKYLEVVKDKIILEKKIEGKVVTSPRQIAEDIINIESLRVQGGIERIINTLTGFYDESFWFVNEINLNEVGHVVFSKRDEFVSKVISNTHDISLISKNNEGYLDGWFNKQLVSKVKMLSVMHGRGNLKINSSMPDYNGYRCYWITNELVNGFIKNDNEIVKLLYPCALKESLSQFLLLYGSEDIVDLAETQKIIFSIPPFANFMFVTGMGIVLAEFFENNEILEIIKNEWTCYLGDDSKKIEFIYGLGLTLDDDTNINMYGLRFNWGRKLYDLLASIPLEYSSSGCSHYAIPEEIYMHPSALVRLYAEKNNMPSYNLWDVFFATFMMTSAYSDKTKFSRNVNTLLSDIEEQEKKYIEYFKSKEMS